MDISLENDFSHYSKSQQVFLWGLPGVGKSTLGKKIADRLGFKYCDLDKLIEQRTGKTIPELFADLDESGFRKEERNALIDCLGKKRTVISCGGGTPIFYSNADEMLASGLVVYLKASSAFIESRLKQAPQKRPLLSASPDLRAYVQHTLAERGPVYERAPLHFLLPTDSLEELVAELAKRLIPDRS